jgi:hypothetical protein
MAISRISSAWAQSNTLTIGSHQADDLIVAWGFRSGFALPTVSSGWDLVLANAVLSANGGVVACRRATSASETFGTWTNASAVGCAVYRGSSGLVYPGGAGRFGYFSLTISLSLAFSRAVDNWLYVAGFYSNTTTDIEIAPTGFTTLGSGTAAGGTREVVHYDTNGPSTLGEQSNYTLTGTAGNYHWMWAELVEIASTGGGIPHNPWRKSYRWGA